MLDAERDELEDLIKLFDNWLARVKAKSYQEESNGLAAVRFLFHKT